MRYPVLPELWRLARREWLKQVLGAAAWLPVPVTVLLSRTAWPSDPGQALAPFLDTLLPEYGDSPAATTLGIDRVMLVEVSRNLNQARLVELGCAWLDQQAGAGGFLAADPAKRESIVAAAEQAAAGTLPRVFFGYTRDLAFRHFYAHPGSWKALAYAGPPQPLGFPGHDRPPGEPLT